VHGLSVEHDDNCSMAGAHGRQGAWERARRDSAGWGAVLVRALIVRMPLVRGTLARHRGGNPRVSREGCVASKAVHRERQRGAANGGAWGGPCWDGPVGNLDSVGQQCVGRLGEKTVSR
jgi:hypothetical protein